MEAQNNWIGPTNAINIDYITNSYFGVMTNSYLMTTNLYVTNILYGETFHPKTTFQTNISIVWITNDVVAQSNPKIHSTDWSFLVPIMYAGLIVWVVKNLPWTNKRNKADKGIPIKLWVVDDKSDPILYCRVDPIKATDRLSYANDILRVPKSMVKKCKKNVAESYHICYLPKQFVEDNNLVK